MALTFPEVGWVLTHDFINKHDENSVVITNTTVTFLSLPVTVPMIHKLSNN